MPRKIKTERGAAFHVLRTATISLVLSVSLTYVAMEIAFGRDPDTIISVLYAKRFGMIISAVMPLTIAPPLSYWLFRFNQELGRARGELQRIARTDQLTGLLNRRGFDEETIKALAVARAARRPVAVRMVDIDHFKLLNDTYGHGHGHGDKALVHVAGVLAAVARDTDFIAGRQGGDEFAMMLPFVSAGEAEAIAKRICTACAQSSVEAGIIVGGVPVSIGVAASRRTSQSLPALMSRADAALYEGKRAGRNRVIVAMMPEPTLLESAA
jgi:diguanylate cyclase (GGDEF)-like protein